MIRIDTAEAVAGDWLVSANGERKRIVQRDPRTVTLEGRLYVTYFEEIEFFGAHIERDEPRFRLETYDQQLVIFDSKTHSRFITFGSEYQKSCNVPCPFDEAAERILAMLNGETL